MKTINLHDALIQYNESKNFEKEINEQERILNEAKSIILRNEDHELNILKLAGMTQNLVEKEKILKSRDRISKFPEVYDERVIKKLAVDYRLRLLPSNLYIGQIDPLLPSVMNQFVRDHEISQEHVKNNFYVLAPAKSFKLQERPVDPIMFYQIEDGKFAFVWKWGNDLTLFRKILYFPIRNGWTFLTPLVILTYYLVHVCTHSYFILNEHVSYVDAVFREAVIGSIVMSTVLLVLGMFTNGFEFLSSMCYDEPYKN